MHKELIKRLLTIKSACLLKYAAAAILAPTIWFLLDLAYNQDIFLSEESSISDESTTEDVTENAE